MNDSRSRRVAALYQAVLDRPAGEREAFLDTACAGDSDLRSELDVLLAHGSGGPAGSNPPAAEPVRLSSESSSPLLPPGTELGPYQIAAFIARGGMGEVYRAIDTRIHRTVALKVLPAGARGRDDRRARFEREASAVARLNHPHICALYDVGSKDDIEFLVMEYLDGETLATRLRRGPIPVAEALTHALALAQAIACAHDAGILHRDLKPGNVMLTAAGVKLLDFGLARWLERPDGVAPRRPSSANSTTRTGAIVGTFSYMAPEQIEGRPCDERADVFCLGLVMHEMLTARHPFARPGAGGIIAGILTGEPASLAAECPDAPAGLEELILKCLAKRPEDRWQQAGDLVRELEALPNESAATTTLDLKRQMAGRKRWLYGAIAGVFALAAAGTAVVGLKLPSRPGSRNLVILPCQARGDATAQAYCDGLTDTLSAKLTPLAVSRGLQMTSTLEVRRRAVSDPEQARREFGATLIIEGGIARAGDALRINYVLLDAVKLQQLDAYSATTPAGDPFAVQDRVVSWAIDGLSFKPSPAERQNLKVVGTQTAEALELSLQGRGYLLDYQKPGNIDAAIDAYNRAIALDSKYAVAYAGLGTAFWRKYESSRDVSWVQQARSVCTQALALDPQLSASHVCTGTVALETGAVAEAVREFELALEREPMSDEANLGLARARARSGAVAAAEETYRRAVALRPQYWATHMWLGTFYRENGRYDDAVGEYELALMLTPDNARLYYTLGGLYTSTGRYQEAIDACRKSASLVPSLPAYANWGSTLANLRRFSEAAEKYEQARRIGPEDDRIDAYLARAYYWSGRRPEAMTLYKRAAELAIQTLRVNPEDIDTRINLADDFAKLGDRPGAEAELNRLPRGLTDPHVLAFGAVVHMDLSNRSAALDWLERAAAHGLVASELQDWIELDPLKNDPRFTALLHRQARKETS